MKMLENDDLLERLRERVEAELGRVERFLQTKPESPERNRWLRWQMKLRAGSVGLQALLDLREDEVKADDIQWPPRDLRGRFEPFKTHFDI
ncbi:MAG TPA: hypothetical protein VKT27_04930 [Candidatus Binataceae bacterium]|nr:hypothetical protein [Candidatus Binataceae bacterium]